MLKYHSVFKRLPPFNRKHNSRFIGITQSFEDTKRDTGPAVNSQLVNWENDTFPWAQSLTASKAIDESYPIMTAWEHDRTVKNSIT